MELQDNVSEIDTSTTVRGFCCVCANFSEFQVKESPWGSVRESMNCITCGSSSRKRHVVKTILETFAPQHKTLDEARQSLRDLSIFSAVSGDNLHSSLGDNNPNFVCSEYFTGVKEGDYQDGIMCQNMERLTFQDDVFDLVITEDVFEHIRRPEAAFKEVNRVLKTGGCHIFTIPFSFHRKTITRVDATTDDDIYILPLEYHIDPIRDYGKALVYTDFGYDMFDVLNFQGFQTHSVSSLYLDAIRFGIADSYIFISRKVRDPDKPSGRNREWSNSKI